jgi:hypothetical protein
MSPLAGSLIVLQASLEIRNERVAQKRPPPASIDNWISCQSAPTEATALPRPPRPAGPSLISISWRISTAISFDSPEALTAEADSSVVIPTVPRSSLLRTATGRCHS